MLHHAEHFATHGGDDVGMLGGLVARGGVAVVEKVLDVFCHLADIEVGSVEDAEFVVAAEIGVLAALAQEVEPEGVVVVIVGQHAHEGGEEVELQCQSVAPLRRDMFRTVEEHGHMVVREGNVVEARGCRAVVGNEDEEGAVEPRLLSSQLHEVTNRPVGIFCHLVCHSLAARGEGDAVGQDIGHMVAAGHDGGAGYVSGALKWAVAQLYTEAYLHEEDKERITELVNEIKKAYHGILEDADFLSDETREKAIEKLDAIRPCVLYPDSWEKYEYKGLDFKGPKDGGTLWEALQAIEAYEAKEEIEEFLNPVDKEKWTVSPQTFNCGYQPLTNSIYILGAYARGDIYNSEMSDEEVLAKLGVSIGHEISHAFDRTGAQFDKDGNMKNWWTKEDKEEFKKRNAKLAEYYNAIHPWEGQDLKGSIMTGEACADMAGMKVALRVASEKENFDYDKFYRAFADLWFVKENLMMARAGIEDEHPLQYLRINCTLQQFDEFLDYYGITEGDDMYLAPEDRVNIW